MLSGTDPTAEQDSVTVLLSIMYSLAEELMLMMEGSPGKKMAGERVSE